MNKHMMNRFFITLTLVLSLTAFNTQAQTVVYSGRYGYDAIAHIDGYMSDIQLYTVLLLIL